MSTAAEPLGTAAGASVLDAAPAHAPATIRAPQGPGGGGARGWLLAAGRYALALLLVVAAILITFAMQAWDVHTFLFSFYAAVVVAAWIGTGPGVLCVVLSVVAVQYFFTPPEWSFEIAPEDVPFTGAFLICAIMSLAWSVQRKRTEHALQQARDTLEDTVAQRTAELVETNAALTNEIAERCAAEEELRRSEMLLAQGQKLSRTASWTLRPATGEMRWSAELFDIFGTDRAAATPSFELFRGRVHPDDRARFDGAMAAALAGNMNFSCEVRIVAEDGGVKHVHALGEIQTGQDREKEIIGTVMDLTERKRTERALHDAEAGLARTLRLATVAELTASIAHEINQPLAAIVANAGACARFLARGPAALPDAREAADCIVNDATRAGEVTRRIRALLRKEAPRHVVIDMNRIVADVIELLRAALDRQRIAIRTELAASLPRVMGDPVQLQQVLVNLVTNAAEAISERGKRPRAVTIRTQLSEDHTVRVSVEDTGIGLDPQNIDRIFDSFYTTKAEGIGVGLSISRSIVEAHGGELSASPVLPHGASFSFAIPAVQAPSIEDQETAQVAAGETKEPAGFPRATPKSPRR